MAHRKGRSVLTGAGIVLGVAILFGVLVANATTQDGVDRLIGDFTGRADVIANATGAFDARLSAAKAQELARVDGVRDAVGSFGFGAELATGEEDEREGFGPSGIGVNGIVLDQARKLQDYELASGRFFRPGAPELVISTQLADDESLKLGDEIALETSRGKKTFTVVGILSETGAGRAFGGQATFTSLAATRKAMGAGEQFTEVSLILDDGTDADRWISTNKDAVPGVRFQNADDFAQGFKSFLGVFGTFLAFFAIITLFIGAFLIYLTLSMAVIERTRMYGTLRALGSTRSQVRRVVYTEALALGAVSTVLGLLLGLALARVLLVLISGLFDLDLPGLTIAPAAVILAVVVGVLVTLGSSLVPALRAGRLAPVEAMRGDYAGEGRLGRSWITGAVFFVIGLALTLAPSGSGEGASPLAPLGVLFILLGSILLVPLLLRPLAAMLGRLTNRLARGVGDIAVLHLAKERSRSAYTLALIMMVMAMIFGSGGLYLSVRSAIDEIVDRQFGSDVFIEGNGPIEPEVADKLKAQKDIQSVTPLRFGFASVYPAGQPDDDENVFMAIIDPSSYFEHSSFFWKDGDDDSAREALTRGQSLLVGAAVADLLKVERDDEIVLDTAKGAQTFEIAGVYRNDPGPPRITVGLPDARRYLTVGNPMGYAVNLADGADPDAVHDAIEDGIGKDYGLNVQTAAQNKEQARSQVAQYFRIIYAILLIAAITGLLGLANTLAMSVVRRFREIGILRAVGVTRSQTWRMVLIESLTLGLVALVLSIPLGGLLTGIIVRTIGTGFGFEMTAEYPWSWIPIVAAFGLVIAVIAAIAPGRRAARLEVVSALQYE